MARFKAALWDDVIGVQILADLGVRSLRLFTNGSKGIKGLERYGLNFSGTDTPEILLTETYRNSIRGKGVSKVTPKR